MATGRGARRLEERKCHSSIQEGGLGELQVSQPHLDHWEGDGEDNAGSHIRACKGQDSHQE